MDISGSNLIFVNAVQHHDVVLDRLWGLVQCRQKVDFGMVVYGQLHHAHQLILGLFFQPEQLQNIAPQHLQGSTLELLLEFVYLGTISVPEKQIDTLLELARQLDFTMLVVALLSAKNSIQMADISTSSPGLRIRNVRSCDTELFPTYNTANSMEVVDHTEIDCMSVLPKFEPESIDTHNNNISSLTFEHMTDVVQQDVNERLAPDVNDGAEYYKPKSDNSITIEEEAPFEIKLENSDSEEFGDSNEAVHSEETNMYVTDSESHNDVDGLQLSLNEIKREKNDNVDSPGIELSGEKVCTNVPNTLNSDLASEHQTEVLDVQSTNEQEVNEVQSINEHQVAVDLEPIKLTEAVETSKPKVQLKNLRVVLKRCQSDLYKMPNTSFGSGKKKLTELNHKSKTKCDMTTENRANASVIRRGAPTNIIGPFKCSVCHKEFKWRRHLNEHFRIHSGKNLYKCKVCKKKFSVSSRLKLHTRIHTGEKPYKCQVCLAQFRRPHHLTDHARTHTGEKPYKCQVCKKGFTRSGSFKLHARIHTGEKPYQCQVCLVQFRVRDHLKDHARTHTGEKPFKCQVCKKAFTRSGHFKKHCLMHTGK